MHLSKLWKYEIGDTVIKTGILYKKRGHSTVKDVVIVEYLQRENWTTTRGVAKEQTYVFFTPLTHGRTFMLDTLNFSREYAEMLEIDLERVNDS